MVMTTIASLDSGLIPVFRYNPANNEHNYVAELAASMSAGG